MSHHHSKRFVTLVNDALNQVDEITPKEVKKKQDKGDDFILYDVRERDEWVQSHIPGAAYLGKGVIERDIESEVPRTGKELILYSGDGRRSVLAADNLQKMGYENVKSMRGGFRSWNEAGLPIEKDS